MNRSPSSMSLRSLLVIIASVGSAGLLAAACSSLPAQSGATSAGPAGAPRAPARHDEAPVFAKTASGSGSSRPEGATELARLVPAQSIIYTASLALRVKNVSAAASLVSSDVTATGGYIAYEQHSSRSDEPPAPGGGRISLRVKIPVAAYRPTLGKLAALGHQLAFAEQAQDVTQQVADVASRVTSAQAAITQLRALLRRAGNVGQLLSVQDEINSQETELEALLAQQRALSRETSYATVTVALIGPHAPVHHRTHPSHRGLIAGLSTGWHGLTAVVVWLLTALGAALPFAVPVALIAGIVVIGRRRLARRRTPPAAATPTVSS